MSIGKGVDRKVTFDTRDKLENKIDKLTVMLGRLAAKDNNERDHLSLKYTKAEKEDKTEVIASKVIRIELD